MTFSVNIKSGTGGYFDYGGCDLHVINLESDSIPRKDEIIHISREGKPVETYLVTSIERQYNIPQRNGKWTYGEFINVYVVPF